MLTKLQAGWRKHLSAWCTNRLQHSPQWEAVKAMNLARVKNEPNIHVDKSSLMMIALDGTLKFTLLRLNLPLEANSNEGGKSSNACWCRILTPSLLIRQDTGIHSPSNQITSSTMGTGLYLFLFLHQLQFQNWFIMCFFLFLIRISKDIYDVFMSFLFFRETKNGRGMEAPNILSVTICLGQELDLLAMSPHPW